MKGMPEYTAFWGISGKKKTDFGGEQSKRQNRHKREALLIANVTDEVHSHKPVLLYFLAFVASANFKEKTMKTSSKSGGFMPLWCKVHFQSTKCESYQEESYFIS